MLRRFYGLAAAVLLAAGMGPVWAQSSRPGWGSTPYADAGGTGVTFRVWAPGASNVNVAGLFNGWSSSADDLVLESVTSGVWSLDVPEAQVEDTYKFVINGTEWRSDPRARVLDELHENAVVKHHSVSNWGGGIGLISNRNDVVIYEAHVGTFMGPSGTFSSFSNRLDYLADLGVSAIELMPINEFPTSRSWGYNPGYPFAIEADYGSPESLKGLVAGARDRGMATLLDVVHNHWDSDSSLWEIDGTTPGPYFYDTDPYAWSPWGPRPDYAREEVREYINDTFRMWRAEYGISGFRWDAPKHIIYTTNDVFIDDGLRLVTNALALMDAQEPGILNIAEDTKEIEGFDAWWDLTFSWQIRDVLTESSDANRDMATVAQNVAGTPGRILFTDSHDTAGDLNDGERLPVRISGSDPEGYYGRKRSALGAALVMTSPGIPMILQGQEMLETNQFSSSTTLDWSRTNSQSGTWRLYRDLIRLRRNLDGVSPGLSGDAASVYHVDNDEKVIAWSRWDSASTGSPTVVMANFANTSRTNYAVAFPEEGTWYAVFNSDSTNYAGDYDGIGSLEVAASGSPASGQVELGRYSTLIFSKTPRSGMLIEATASADGPVGNGDGVLDPGETIREEIVLWNKSQLAATNVSARLTSLTPGVTVQEDVSAYDAMAPDGRATNHTDFSYALDPALACGSAVHFQLVASFNGQTVTNVLDHLIGQPANGAALTNVYEVNVPTPIPDDSTVYSDLVISEGGSYVIRDVDVRLRIDHPFDRDLVLALQHPDGSEVLLVNRRGRSGNDFGSGDCGAAVYTVLDQDAVTAIGDGQAPFAGSYRLESTLDMLAGKVLDGTWRLRMTDADSRDAGTNLCWSLQVVYEQQGCSSTPFTNQPPVAAGTNFVLAPSASTNWTFSGNDPEGQTLDFMISSEPAHGVVSLLSAATGEAFYRPVAGFAGTDTVGFAVSDGVLTSPEAQVTFEIQAPADANTNRLPDGWEITYYTNLGVALPEGDSDGDGMTNLEEARAGTHPRDSNSVLRMLPFETGGGTLLRWASVGGTRYRVEWSDDLEGGVFQPVVRSVADELDPGAQGEESTLSFTDDYLGGAETNGGGMRTYRIRVLNE